MSEDFSDNKIKALIDTAIDDMMESEFENAMEEWDNIKLFDLNTSHFSDNLKIKDSRMAKTLKKAISLIQENNIVLNAEGQNAIAELNELITRNLFAETNEQYKSLIYKDRTLKALKDSFYAATHNELNGITIDPDVYNTIAKLLDTRDAIREAMREYFWNTTFAET